MSRRPSRTDRTDDGARSDDRNGSAVRGTDGVVATLVALAEHDPDRIVIGDLRTSLTVGGLLARAVPLAARLLEDDAVGPVRMAPRDPIGMAVGMAAAAAVGRRVAVTHRSDAVPHPGTAPEVPGDPVAAFTAIAGRRPPSHVVVDAMTSGSTADPRPVGVTSFGQFMLGGVHTARPFTATSAFACLVWHVLLSGGRLTGFDLRSGPVPATLERLAGAGVQVLATVPSVLRRLGAPGHAGALPDLTAVTVAGEPLVWSDVAAARALTAGRAEVVNHYSSTETHRICQRPVAPGEPLGTGVVSVGRPVADRSVSIRDEAGDDLPEGVVGRVVVDGPFDRVVHPPFERRPDGRRRFRSGDAGRLDADGELHLVGRLDRVVKVRGVRVEPALLQDLLRRVPGVLDVAVLPVGAGDHEVRLVAHVVVGPRPPSLADLRDALTPHVPDVLVPARFVLRARPLPLLPGGKVDARALLAG